MSELEPSSAAVEFKALQAIVRALARTVACQSPHGLSDLLTCLQIEAGRVALGPGEGEGAGSAVADALTVWADELMQGGPALGDVETRDASGRAVHFVD